MSLEQIQELIMRYVPSIVGVIALLIGAFIVAGWIGRIISRVLAKAKVEETLCKFFGNMSRWLILIMAIIACLGVFGVETTSFAALLGAAGLAIGLAFQGSLSNLAAGVMLLLFRPFKVGDAVSIGGHTGVIHEISLFTTQMDTFDNRRIILPNGCVFGSTIENITFNATRRVDISVGVDYTADLDQTRTVLTEAAMGVEGRLDDPPVQIILLNLGDSSIDWQVRIWTATETYWDVLDAGTRAVKMALDAAGIGIPFPQMDVHMPDSTKES